MWRLFYTFSYYNYAVTSTYSTSTAVYTVAYSPVQSTGPLIWLWLHRPPLVSPMQWQLLHSGCFISFSCWFPGVNSLLGISPRCAYIRLIETIFCWISEEKFRNIMCPLEKSLDLTPLLKNGFNAGTVNQDTRDKQLPRQLEERVGTDPPPKGSVWATYSPIWCRVSWTSKCLILYWRQYTCFALKSWTKRSKERHSLPHSLEKNHVTEHLN